MIDDCWRWRKQLAYATNNFSSGVVLDSGRNASTPPCRCLRDYLRKGGFQLWKMHRRDLYRRSQGYLQGRIR